MMNQWSGRPWRRPAASIFSAKTWKREWRLTGVTGYVPFGPSKPRRVPCPPATVNAATRPARSAASPVALAAAHAEALPPFEGRRS